MRVARWRGNEILTALGEGDEDETCPPLDTSGEQDRMNRRWLEIERDRIAFHRHGSEEARQRLAEEMRRLDADEIYREALTGIDKVSYQ